MRFTVCADCHSADLGALRGVAERVGASVRAVDCLDACDTPDVLVVQRPGAAPVWLGWVRGEAVLADVAAWLTSGGPLPEVLELHRVAAPGLRKAQWASE
ncbi:(2Fe-2S) ferredoxin domain-containing protein [Actinokineospora sp. NPDC004072]